MMAICIFNPRSVSRRGYSLLEIMIVLAIMSISVAFLAPRAGAALDQVVVHTLQFDLQRQISDLRRQAFLTQRPLRLAFGAAQAPSVTPQQSAAATDAVAVLPKAWSAKLDAAVILEPSGLCTPARLALSSLGKRPIYMMLNKDCQLIRYFGPPPP